MAQKYFKPSYLTSLLTDFMALLYPQICIGCKDVLHQSEDTICFECSIDMPRTYFENKKGNPVERLFWFKTKIEEATSGYFFSKKSRIQNMIHAFKYHGNDQSAIYLGELLGNVLRKSSRFKSVDYIIPVPLHPKKLEQRGYNQAEKIAIGVSRVLEVPILTNCLIRTTANDTQTKKSIFNRWENVKTIFEVKNPNHVKNKHILLLDDVITSGSTIEAGAQKIIDCENTKVSVASLAVANG
ncbi:MAG: ComF family protein [Salibacteraceae bacterium]